MELQLWNGTKPLQKCGAKGHEANMDYEYKMRCLPSLWYETILSLHQGHWTQGNLSVCHYATVLKLIIITTYNAVIYILQSLLCLMLFVLCFLCVIFVFLFGNVLYLWDDSMSIFGNVLFFCGHFVSSSYRDCSSEVPDLLGRWPVSGRPIKCIHPRFHHLITMAYINIPETYHNPSLNHYLPTIYHNPNLNLMVCIIGTWFLYPKGRAVLTVWLCKQIPVCCVSPHTQRCLEVSEWPCRGNHWPFIMLRLQWCKKLEI